MNVLSSLPVHRAVCVCCQETSEWLSLPEMEALGLLFRRGWAVETQPTCVLCPDCAKKDWRARAEVIPFAPGAGGRTADCACDGAGGSR